jgi:hypothetical protein
MRAVFDLFLSFDLQSLPELKTMKHKSARFTLAGLFIVVAIAGILLALFLPAGQAMRG